MNKNILHIPSLMYFGNDWDVFQRFLKYKGNPPYHFDDDLDLERIPIKYLRNLISVKGELNLHDTPIKDLGNLTSVDRDLYLGQTSIKSLGNLKSVGGSLYLFNSPVESLGNLKSVGGDLIIYGTPISKKMKDSDIKDQVNIGGHIYHL